jgi:DNA-binding LytR/AlgR family response regulator
MVTVAICDDEIKIGAELERALINIFDKLNVKYEIDVFLSGEELCRELDSKTHYDLLFLDIELTQNGINGVEMGRHIRNAKQNYAASIVYISWEKKYALQLFEVQPLHFLIKPLEHDKIEEVIRLHMKITGQWDGAFTYKIGHDTYKVRVKDIIYLESYDKKLILHLADGRKETFYGSLKEIYQEQLKRFDFIFIHNSYIVNYDYLTALKFDQVLLTGSVTPLPVSKHRRIEVRETYYEIMKRRAVTPL